MKCILTFVLALAMALSLAACGGKADDNNGKTDVDMTAQQIMDTLKEKLGDSFDCDVTEDEARMSGYWGFDMDKINGRRLTLGTGREGEPFEGIGRGPLNIEHLPVYRDTTGGIGTPTSDNERTKMGLQTRHLVALVNGYDGNEDTVRATAELIIKLVNRFCKGQNARYFVYR